MNTLDCTADLVSELARVREKTPIAVIDDHPLVLDGLANLINQQDDLRCCWAAGSPEKALEALAGFAPQLVVLDLRLRNGNSLGLLHTLLQRQPGLKVLVLSQYDDAFYDRSVSVEEALRAGALGFVPKELAVDCLLTAVRRVLAGHFYVTRGMAARLRGDLALSRGKEFASGTEHLSERESEVLSLLGWGRTTREIAEQLQVSLKTVETYRENLKHKLELRDGPELIQFAANWVQEYVTWPAARDGEEAGCKTGGLRASID
jgi:DNA-binding NarL/FixJ family response regulator